ncbi:MAG TPA: glycosyltransferase family 4 protein, partial [Gemmatimonadaceae bacterium]
MKIALVSDWYPPRRGGIESHLSELGRRLADAGHEVHVVTSTRGGDAPTAPNAVAVHRLDARLLPGLDLVFTPRGIKAIARTLDEIEPDVVHSHVSIVSPVAFAGAHHAQRRHLATVLTFHSFIPATRAYMRGAALLTGSRRWRAVFTAVSGRVAREVAPFSGSRPVGLLPNAVDVSYWRPAAEQQGSGDAPLRIVSAMRLN